jgi:chromate transporter
MHRIAVEGVRWMTDKQFADMCAISQMSPGPNVVIVTLIGFHVAGIAIQTGLVSAAGGVLGLFGLV